MKKGEKLVAVKEGVTAMVRAWRYPPEAEVYGTVRVCGVDDEGKPFDVTFQLEEFAAVDEAVSSVVEAVREVSP